MNALIGNTYPHRDIIKKRGGKWNSEKKCWMVPTQHYEELSELCVPTKDTRWGTHGCRYEEECVLCHRHTVICNYTEICERCFSK